jgi:hypothetical protein
MEIEEEKISPEKALEILKKDGLEVTLEFLSLMAEIVVDQYLET